MNQVQRIKNNPFDLNPQHGTSINEKIKLPIRNKNPIVTTGSGVLDNEMHAFFNISDLNVNPIPKPILFI